jgi:hypothetical protein
LLAAALTLVVPMAAMSPSGESADAGDVNSGELDPRIAEHATRLVGVNLMGAEYACVQWGGFLDTDRSFSELAADIAAWNANTVRLPLNEHCWLGGFEYIDADAQGASYRRNVLDLVGSFNAAGLNVILDLHWNAPRGREAKDQTPMPDADYAPAFWRSVATTFADNDQVVFDLFNEPHGVSWACWRDGCVVDGYQAAGMQTLIDAVRATGAENPVIINGLDYAGNLREFGAHAPVDPLGRIIVGFHAYEKGDGFMKRCITSACFDAELKPIIEAGYGLIFGEVGEVIGLEDCSADFVDDVLNWADDNGAGYTLWAYHPAGCSNPSLITSWNGSATEAGQVLKQHLARR